MSRYHPIIQYTQKIFRCNPKKSECEMEVVKLMQKKQYTLLDDIFIKEFGTLYDKIIENRCCFLCIVNIMKRLLLETIPPTIIK